MTIINIGFKRVSLSNMSMSGDDSNMDMVDDTVDVVLSAMDRFHDVDAAVLEGACITLRNLAMDDASSVVIANRGGTYTRLLK